MAKKRSSEFGLRLQELRAAANLTQAQLAERAGMHLFGIAKLEHGEREPAWSTVLNLAKALGVNVSTFAEVSPPKCPTDPLLARPDFWILWGAWNARAHHYGELGQTPDQDLIAAARRGWQSTRDFVRFGLGYKVLRGPLGEGVRLNGRMQPEVADRLRTVIGIFNRCYGGRVEPGVAVAGLWWNAVTQLKDALEPHRRYRSLCLKALWFHQPENTTMWDDLAARGLRREAGSASIPSKVETQADAEEFLREFERVFDRQRNRIEAAIQALQSHHRDKNPYPYARRVLDKALWFRGIPNSPSERADVANFLANKSARQWVERTRVP